ncbi:YIP1 family protein [Gallaecimonas xiamenensis]|uniref:Yip1 domain-containing protein n=1 Tax=Gallaecimonas xiamenensis 3-C-1 TaxID=745411 RepID=K2JKM7_9GAMM|nr:YIP1 family protein [Gallaecimonas xiamenensis]EKE71089.1 hypothetical protein B3C1_13069 [Gallaecimonas xiamenensis 3-C-1]
MPYHALLSLWTQPRATLHEVMRHRPGNSSVGLVVVAGYLWFAQQFLIQDIGSLLVTFALLALPIGAIVLLYFQAWAIRHVCRWFDGKGDGLAIRASLAWGGVPAMVGMVLWLLGYLLYGDDMLWMEQIPAQAPENSAALLLGLLGAAFNIHGLVVTCKMLSEANGFNAWIAFAAMLVTVMLVVAAAMVVAMPLVMLFGPSMMG